MAIDSSEWSSRVAELSALNDRIATLIEIAVHTNQLATIGELVKLQSLWRTISVQVTVFGRSGPQAADLSRQLASAFGDQIHTTVIEAADYAQIAPAVWETARSSAAIVFLVPAAAPLFDDTRDVLTREFSAVSDRVFVTVAAGPRSPSGLADAIVPEVKQLFDPAAITVCTAPNLPANLNPFLAERYLAPLIGAMQIQIVPIVSRLEPVASAFAVFLATGPAELGQRLEFIERDLQALRALSTEAQATLQTRSQTALSGVSNQIVSLSTAMHQKTDALVQAAVIPHDVLSSQDARTRFGKDLTANARAAGYREFDLRVQAIAASLDNARSLTLAQLDQARDEAEAHLEELRENVGADLFRTFLKPPLDAAAIRPFDVPLEPGNQFAAAATQALQAVRDNCPDVPFAANWAGRIESLFRPEMIANAGAGWNIQNVDGPAAFQAAQLWQDTVQRQCGLLIGRIDALCESVGNSLDALRLKNLQAPRDPTTRAALAAIFTSYASLLKEMQQNVVTVHPAATT